MDSWHRKECLSGLNVIYFLSPLRVIVHAALAWKCTKDAQIRVVVAQRIDREHKTKSLTMLGLVGTASSTYVLHICFNQSQSYNLFQSRFLFSVWTFMSLSLSAYCGLLFVVVHGRHHSSEIAVLFLNFLQYVPNVFEFVHRTFTSIRKTFSKSRNTCKYPGFLVDAEQTLISLLAKSDYPFLRFPLRLQVFHTFCSLCCSTQDVLFIFR